MSHFSRDCGAMEVVDIVEEVLSGHVQVVKAAIEAGYDVNTRTPKGTSLAGLAVLKNNTKMLRLLLDANADANDANERGRSALMMAAFDGEIESTQLLLSAGAKINAKNNQDETALLITTTWGHAPLAQILLTAGADVNVKNSDGRSPIMNACYRGNFHMIEMFWKWPSLKKSKRLKTYMRKCIALSDDQNQIQKLGRIIGVPEYFYMGRVIESGDVEYLRRAIDAGADLENVDKGLQNEEKQGTALTEAVQLKHWDLIPLLLEANVNVNASSDGGQFYPIMGAAYEGHEKTVELLIKAKADVNARSNGNITPLILSSFQKNVNIGQMLIDAGADLDALDNEGRSALFYATVTGNLALGEALVNANADNRIQYESTLAALIESTLVRPDDKKKALLSLWVLPSAPETSENHLEL